MDQRIEQTEECTPAFAGVTPVETPEKQRCERSSQWRKQIVGASPSAVTDTFIFRHTGEGRTMDQRIEETEECTPAFAGVTPVETPEKQRCERSSQWRKQIVGASPSIVTDAFIRSFLRSASLHQPHFDSINEF